ncbi:hypothetical protein BKA67DRAFT_657064 [Truncatella angustata]|uniref:Uncharacterized protein n=1 Tax=Truncatella angustata TaxID=152316 RepID=A0A9P8ZZI3_9PEZI|nr:uncharacterized protein BKA67DRAFT_657064 [Truncatella angustata]KAH6655105.1 hypothetical protein BKA67DRAFT_657064 [Truncatella angustata]KAH8198223.1 hypothetical protein TruAng_007607 [Truncatella angustata]
MLEAPDSKWVRREDLHGDATSDGEIDLDEAAKDELRAKLNAQLSGLFDFGLPSVEAELRETQPMETDETDTAPAEEPEELAYEFRLFRDEAPSHTVVIGHDDDNPKAPREGAFVVPKRPMSYYVAEKPDSAAMKRFRFAAVTSDYIFGDAVQNRWGLEKPWRVAHITVTSRLSGKTALTSASGDIKMVDGKRKRVGKKRRIILRAREKAEKEKADAAKKYLEEKEEHLAAKKKRLNREKKLKRRAKEKEKKTTAGDNPEHATSNNDGNVSDGNSET